MIRLIPYLLLGLLVASGCATLRPFFQRQSTIDQARLELGIAVYRSNYCGTCHTLTMANTRGTFGPNHDHARTVARQTINTAGYSGAATTPDEYIRESILAPAVFYTPGYEASNHHMPTFTYLPDPDVDALVYLLVNQE